MTDRELMQMVLDALSNFDKGNHGMRWQVPLVKALRARLAQPEPQREWVGLTDEEIIKLQHLIDWTAHWSTKKFARAIEAKLKDKNGD